jgi:FkbM family methyltransferase
MPAQAARVRELNLPPGLAFFLNEVYSLVVLACPAVALGCAFAPLTACVLALALYAAAGVTVDMCRTAVETAVAVVRAPPRSALALGVLEDDLSLIATCVKAGRLWEPWMRTYIEAFADPEGVACDIGAHYGTHSVVMCQSFEHVHCFEPQKDVAAVLRSNLALQRAHASTPADGHSDGQKKASAHNSTVHTAALSDQERKVAFLSQRTSMTGLVGVAGEGDAQGEAVATITLDSLELDRVAFIKVGLSTRW